jgi:uncharacterized protein (DUF2252 family)
MDLTAAERRAAGAAKRQVVPRGTHGVWAPAAGRADPVDVLVAQGRGRISALLPVRYARMRADPFAFLRGAAAVMAADLAGVPASGIRLQSCGDAHLANFGVYASPEGAAVFDVNDFDETLPAPFEWDLKRLATSLVVAALVAGEGRHAARKLACAAARSYRQHMGVLAGLAPLEAWNQRVDLVRAVAGIGAAKLRARVDKRLAGALASGAAHFGLVERLDGGGVRIRESEPLVYRLDEHELPARAAFAAYAETLQEDRRVLLARYTLRDVAFKAAGVGSVGTFCAIALLTDGDGAPLLLQIKQAQESVLAAHAGASAYENQGERVVVGQRMMQAASDVFLGWTCAPIDGRDFYVRRLKDTRLAGIGTLLEGALPFYAGLCGLALARAHARAGDAAMVAGYAGGGTALDEAMGDFAMAYADQTERDFGVFCGAVREGRIGVREA